MRELLRMSFSRPIIGVLLLSVLLSIFTCSCMQSDRNRYQSIWDIAHEEGRYENAVSEFTDFIEERPESEWTTYAWLQMGDCFLNLGNEEKAIECFKSVIEADWNECTTNQALGCLEHLNSFHETRYPLHSSGRCPVCRI